MKPEKKTKRIDIRVKVTYEACVVCNVSTDIAEALEHVQDNFPYEITTYNTCNDDKAARRTTWEGIAAVGARYGYTVEACGEPDLPPTPCLSQKDIDILGLQDKIFLESSAGQRKTCGCPANKSELIRKGRPHRCEHKCIYCFWKDKEETEAAPNNGM